MTYTNSNSAHGNFNVINIHSLSLPSPYSNLTTGSYYHHSIPKTPLLLPSPPLFPQPRINIPTYPCRISREFLHTRVS
jgi:hypothetical protein